MKDKLSDVQLRSIKPTERPFRVFDGGGLFLEVRPNGARYWRWKYRFAGKEKLLALGVYPRVGLKAARSARNDARDLLDAGTDPSADRRQQRLRAHVAEATSFEAIAKEYVDKQRAKLAPNTLVRLQWMLDKLLLPWLKGRPIAAITPPELLAQLRRTESRGKYESAHRAHQLASRIFRYAIATGRAERDPAADLRGALHPKVTSNRAAITHPAAVAELLQKIHGYTGQPATCAALKLAPLLFVRPGELRAAEWSEFDLEAAEWRLPAARMKMREAHLVPLSTQAVAILADLKPLTGRGKYVFPSVRTGARPLSENTINAALRALGYESAAMSAHGFRAMASTLLHELGWKPDIIERQLAHAERNKVRAAYNRAQHLVERRAMMQAWSDHLDGLRAGAKVVPIGAARKKRKGAA